MANRYFKVLSTALALIACTQGVAAQDAARSTPPRPAENPGYWISQKDYPFRAMREDKEGRVRFQLDVGPEGRVAGCAILSSSGSVELDEATCSLMRERAVFIPARDDNGRVTSGTWRSAISWKLPFPYPVRKGEVYLGILPVRQSPGGVRVGAVLSGPARDAGLMPGDLIKRIDGREVRDAPQAAASMSSLRIGSVYAIEIERGGQTLQYQVDARAFPRDRDPAQRPLKREMWDRAREFHNPRGLSTPYL